MDCSGQFTITGWDENTLSEKLGGIKHAHASVTQNYEGAMVGQSNVEFIMSYQSSTSAVFVGFESFVGVLKGKRGTISFKHDGNFNEGIASSTFTSVEGSATGELSGCSIAGTFASGESGKAQYNITVEQV